MHDREWYGRNVLTVLLGQSNKTMQEKWFCLLIACRFASSNGRRRVPTAPTFVQKRLGRFTVVVKMVPIVDVTSWISDENQDACWPIFP